MRHRSRSSAITGARLNLIRGSCENVQGPDVGPERRARGNGLGLEYGLVGIPESMRGLPIGTGGLIQKGRYEFLPIVDWSM